MNASSGDFFCFVAPNLFDKIIKIKFYTEFRDKKFEWYFRQIPPSESYREGGISWSTASYCKKFLLDVYCHENLCRTKN